MGFRLVRGLYNPSEESARARLSGSISEPILGRQYSERIGPLARQLGQRRLELYAQRGEVLSTRCLGRKIGTWEKRRIGHCVESAFVSQVFCPNC